MKVSPPSHKVKAGQAAHLDGSLPLATHRCLRNVLPGNQLHKTLASGLRDKQVYTVTIFGPQKSWHRGVCVEKSR